MAQRTKLSMKVNSQQTMKDYTPVVAETPSFMFECSLSDGTIYTAHPTTDKLVVVDWHDIGGRYWKVTYTKAACTAAILKNLWIIK